MDLGLNVSRLLARPGGNAVEKQAAAGVVPDAVSSANDQIVVDHGAAAFGSFPLHKVGMGGFGCRRSANDAGC